MKPTPYLQPDPQRPVDWWFKRAVVALFLERRLPYRVSVAVDRMMNWLGLRHKVLRTNGFRVKVRRLTTDEVFVHNILVRQEYTPPGYDIREGDVVIDIGGNIGVFALLAARRATRGKVITLEPVSENYKLLEENVALNKLTNVFSKRAAVLSNKGTVTMYLNATNTGCHSVFQRYGTNPADAFEAVDSVTLPDVFAEFGIDRCSLLKLDCEGSEYEILGSLPHEYFHRIDRIVMEYHTTTTDDPRAQADVLVTDLENRGYHIDAYEEFRGGGFIRARRRSWKR